MSILRRCDPINGCSAIYPDYLDNCPKCGNPHTFSEFVIMRPFDVAWDIETYPNAFTNTLQNFSSGQVVQFEISSRKNQIREMLRYLTEVRDGGGRMFGFNSIAFDYPVLHYILNNKTWVTPSDIYNFAMLVIRDGNSMGPEKFKHIVWDRDQLIPQVDLFKIYHFDNPAKRTGLKQIEFSMLMESIQDLPFPVGKLLDDDEIDVLLSYNAHDVDATARFVAHSHEAIAMREELTEKFDFNFMNQSDVGLGTRILVNQIEKKNPNACYEYVDGRRRPRQTWRASIPLSSVIFPYIQFEHPDFQRVHNWLLNQTIVETKGVFENLNASLNGFTFFFGTGGIHGSVDSSHVASDDKFVIVDIDAVSYYPSLSIENRVAPAHIGQDFCDAYAELKAERLKYPKETAKGMNTAYKFGLNGTFGNTNNDYSPFLDPWFTMAITMNGQLLLCKLAEQLTKHIPSLKVIQANTDGLTVILKRSEMTSLNHIVAWWEQFTCMKTEQVEYTDMWIRDVNNYIAKSAKDGKLKRKGAYCHMRPWEKGADLEWHKDHSMLVVPKAAEAALVHGVDIRDFVMSHQFMPDFMIRQRAKGKDRLVLKIYDCYEQELSKTVRYYVSKIGGEMFKVMPPLYHKGKTEDRWTGVNVGYKVSDCSHTLEIDRTNIDYGFYIREAEKLVKPCLPRFVNE